MTQIQALENMSKEALIEHHRHTLQQHADDMDMLSKELASRAAPFDPYRILMADQAELINIERLQRWLTKYGISTPESLEELGARRGHYVNALTRQEPFALARSAPVVMGNGDVAVGTITRGDDGTPGIIYLRLPEVREHNTDCSDIYPVGSAAPDDSILACIYFGSSEVLQQTIDVLFDLQREHYPIAPVAAQAQWIEHCNITDIPDAVLTTSGLAIKSEQADTQEPDQALLISMACCLHHGFGLLSKSQQDSMLQEMRKLWDEVMGRGYYSPSTRDLYMAMLNTGVQGSSAFKSVATVHPTVQAGLGGAINVLGPVVTEAIRQAFVAEEAAIKEKLVRIPFRLPEKRACGNPQCGWQGYTDRLCGSVGPLCPECGETTEPICSCPTGDGSLRWPCPVHPPATDNLTKSSNQQMASKPPETPQQIVASLRDLSERMKTVGASMSYFGGFNGAMDHHGRELAGASVIAWDWADGIEKDISVDTTSPTTDTD